MPDEKNKKISKKRLTIRRGIVILTELSQESKTKAPYNSSKNLENQRSINTQTLKILRIRISETMQIVSEFIRSKE